ncbi:MAG: hypothetical protein UR34_C0006G0008 [candidate division WS6 bacterium GW2011_GWC1_33_20]|uniref:Uncharacterized protein n=2 Tax=Candidatus Dojkabacteria TaxID=74243 RepID=A0A0G0ADA6_9BACT|nr:MAG: hypothetical protein UR32_C0020G0004 [candidate division WS6 bacterium GW2011_GWE2_33_157]KKP44087.1 MAG: hypothetical protein UR34_C0006G0008 [candidate division WS6 bacterium GW2011_GWC1_33_20]KKP45041.1 MAG: hypothetical protein UR36_C0011G0018 [candidate division WS6 bacterium GW2011_GWF1_33_233]KKP54208.1 MAG: hypothetical protein UR45_C0022G0004 [candidate division WS6 bacterium GW2011_WS6_33_547]KKP54578.1 MAG: hypothetical protein UR47_C0014G0020 [candidate division WS6 bacteriu
MQRGILKLTNDEVKELLNHFNLENHKDTPLGNKLGSIDLNLSEVEILLSEDEVETIMDEIGIPVGNITMDSLIQKLSNFMMTLRS